MASKRDIAASKEGKADRTTRAFGNSRVKEKAKVERSVTRLATTAPPTELACNVAGRPEE